MKKRVVAWSPPHTNDELAHDSREPPFGAALLCGHDICARLIFTVVGVERLRSLRI